MPSNAPTPKLNHKPAPPTPKPTPNYKSFFKTYNITNAEIADWLKVSEQIVGQWLNGTKPIPANRRAELLDLKHQVEVWAKEQGLN